MEVCIVLQKTANIWPYKAYKMSVKIEFNTEFIHYKRSDSKGLLRVAV